MIRSYNRLITLGAHDSLPLVEFHHLRISNKFSLLCLAYSIPFIFFSLSYHFYTSAVIFMSAYILLISSLYLNYTGRYHLSKLVIILTCGLSVAYLSILYGFESGFHLYYFTGPLIIFSFFSHKDFKNIVGYMAFVLICIGSLIFFKLNNFSPQLEVPLPVIERLYIINVVLVLSFIIFLISNLSGYHNKTYKELIAKNDTLILNHNLLQQEIIKKNLSQELLKESLKEKDILLSETHHRVKNNLAVVAGMLDLQLMKINNAEAFSCLLENKNRIRSMSLIHELLYQSENLSKIHFKKYLELINKEIKQVYTGSEIHFHIKGDEVELDVTKAVPCALLYNEVINNACKHAFKNTGTGNIYVSCEKKDGLFRLNIKDDGSGMKPETDPLYSIGMMLIDTFTRQIDGTYEYYCDKGTHFNLQFKN